jgi:phage tail sheath protein FI
MPTYLSPGVFVEEVSRGSRPIEGVGTSVAAFVGLTPKGDARPNEPVAVNNWSEFVRTFAPDAKIGNPLANAVYAFFLNGGTRCWIVNTGDNGPISGNGRGLDKLAVIDEVAMFAAPAKTDVASYEALLTAAESLGDRVAILDGPERVENVEQLTRVGTEAPSPTGEDGAPPSPPTRARGAPPPPREGGRARKSKYGAYYFPWTRMRDPFDPNQLVSVPPSGAVMGICARTDAERGVHKAPANATVRGALGLTQMISKAEQEILNPAGVNCLRMFVRDGVLLWGARTLDDGEWKYLNVRRLFNMVEESIARGTSWVVFEPNDRPLWKAIRRDIGAFLTLLWRQGALMGATPEEAFFVKCDEETNPPDVIDAGQVVTLVGLAPVKPAEFVIFRIGQSAAGATIESA